MEKALAAIHQARLRQGPMTLAYGCVDGQVALLLQCGAGDREAVLGPIAAGYPQCSLVAVEDPAVPVGWTTWCVNVQLEPELFPILRHAQFEDLLTQLRTTRLLHHSVRVAHHLFQAIMREIMATSQQTGVSVRDLLTAVSGGNGHAGCVDNRLPPPDAAAQADGDTPGVELSAGLVSAALADAGVDPPECAAPPAVEPDDTDDIAPSFPPHLMAKRAAPAGSCEGITDDCVRELEGKMQRLQDTMDTLIGAIDEFRDDVVYTLRNLPDRMPPPLHIHSLPLDPTDADFAGRVNAVPPDVIARLRDEAVQGREAESAPVAAAEGNPSPAPMLDETPPDNRRHLARQPRLFA